MSLHESVCQFFHFVTLLNFYIGKKYIFLNVISQAPFWSICTYDTNFPQEMSALHDRNLFPPKMTLLVKKIKVFFS